MEHGGNEEQGLGMSSRVQAGLPYLDMLHMSD